MIAQQYWEILDDFILVNLIPGTVSEVPHRNFRVNIYQGTEPPPPGCILYAITLKNAPLPYHRLKLIIGPKIYMDVQVCNFLEFSNGDRWHRFVNAVALPFSLAVSLYLEPGIHPITAVLHIGRARPTQSKPRW